MKFTFLSKAHYCRVLCVTVLGAFLLAPNAHAFRFTQDEIKGFIDTTVSSGLMIRVARKKHGLIGIADGGTAYAIGQAGDLNYSKGNVVSAANEFLSEAGLSYHNFNAFVRASYFVDPVNFYNKSLTAYERKNAGQAFQLLDAYVEGKFEPAGHALDVRVGKQVLNWGESLFIPGGLSVTNAADLSKLMLPGAEVRDALLPSPMIMDSYQLTDQLSLSNYYIFKFDRMRTSVCGTYFATDNATCEDGNGDITGGYGFFPEGTPGWVSHRVSGNRPSNHGQYGAALRYLAAELNDTEFGFYFMNYHNHAGSGSAVASLAGDQPFYRVDYVENLQSYGVSVSTDVAGVALQSEYSYRPRYPLQIEINDIFAAAQYFPGAGLPAAQAPGDVVRGYREMPVQQLQVNMTKAFGHENPFGAQEWNVAAEAAMIYISHFPKQSDLRFEAPGTDLAAYGGVGSPDIQTSGWADRLSWGYVLATSTTYQQVVRNVDLMPRIAFSQDVQGTTPAPLSQFVADRLSVNVGMTAKYLEKWSVDLGYTKFAGAEDRNALGDRDFVNLTVKHWF